MTQIELDAPLRALARSTDPDTSHHAAAALDAPRIADRVLQELRENGPGTAHELATRMNLSLVTVSPRIAPLVRLGKVSPAGKIGGRTVWKAVAGA
jgi:predicted transcriptional regulator